jgi:outer membrane protein TolC
MAADSIFATALFLRPELAVLDAWAARTNAEISLAEWAFYPAIGASLTYFDIASGDIPASADGRNALAVGFTVKVPLDRSSRRADLQAARLRAAQITAEREALETAIVTSVTAHLHHAHHEYEALQLYRTRLLPQAETTVESTLAAYTTGQADFLTLLDAERARFELHIAEAEAETRYLIAAARLARALGVPSVYDLGALR